MWTPDALSSEARSYSGTLWRVVEDQAKASTMRLTDTLDEQRILEESLERSKPPIPRECARLDYLLATPFRYAPYPRGSRFRRADQPEGVFYASEAVETAVAEAAFYRLLFFAESPETRLPSRPVQHTAFSVSARTDRLIDLTAPPLDRDEAVWTHKTAYAPCQELADAARAAAIDALRYRSVRDPEQRANVALLSPRAFGSPRPRSRQTWHIFPRPQAVQAWCESPLVRLEFRREHFAADPRLSIESTRSDGG